MSKLLPFVCLLFLIGFTPSCKNNSKAAEQTENTESQSDNYEEMAKAMCECLKPMAAIVEKIESLSAASDLEQLEAVMEEMEPIVEEAEACADRQADKYGEPEDEDKANEALKKVCPEVAALMEGGFEGELPVN